MAAEPMAAGATTAEAPVPRLPSSMLGSSVQSWVEPIKKSVRQVRESKGKQIQPLRIGTACTGTGTPSFAGTAPIGPNALRCDDLQVSEAPFAA